MLAPLSQSGWTLPGIRELEGRGVHYFAKRVEDFRNRNVVIVGGGDSAVDWAVMLEPVASQVTMIHRSRFRAHEATVRQLEESTVDINYPGCEITAVHTNEDGSPGQHHVQERHRGPAHHSRGRPHRRHRIRGRSWADENLGLRIAAESDHRRQDDDGNGFPGVYAAGDVVAYPAKFKLIVTGAAEAVTAVNHAVTHYDPEGSP